MNRGEVRTVVIAKRFCGPPTSGNGGYTCALVAQALGGTAEVTLRKPIPIERELQIVADDDAARALLKDEETLIAEGEVAAWRAIAAPRSPSFQEAATAAKSSPAFGNHPFPTCFVCGPQ